MFLYCKFYILFLSLPLSINLFVDPHLVEVLIRGLYSTFHCSPLDFSPYSACIHNPVYLSISIYLSIYRSIYLCNFCPFWKQFYIHTYNTCMYLYTVCMYVCKCALCIMYICMHHGTIDLYLTSLLHRSLLCLSVLSVHLSVTLL